MMIEKLTENKIRVTLNIDDLKEKDVDFHSFMSNPIESQQLFLDMLNEAEKKVGFITDNYKIMIEALALANGNFVFTITRIVPESSGEKMIRKKVHIKRKTNYLNSRKTVYCFQNFDDFCEFCHSLNSMIQTNYTKLIKNTSLYLYKEKYYLVFSDTNANYEITRHICSCITEFGFFVNSSELFERKLFEYGKEIIKSNAIATCLKHF